MEPPTIAVSQKRKATEADPSTRKKARADAEQTSAKRLSSKGKDRHNANEVGESSKSSKATATTEPPKRQRNKLAPPRPFPSVPTSSNATGPRSARVDGNNNILVTRKNPLGMYLRRCKDCVLQHGFRTINLSAMGAAIPQLLLLATSIPDTLPDFRDQIQTEYKTGTVKAMDELLPVDDDVDELPDLVERKVASLTVTITIGDGKRQTTGREKKSKPRKGKTMLTAGARQPKEKELELSSDDDIME